jgi:transitional endoplasmic reticulum ATPase
MAKKKIADVIRNSVDVGEVLSRMSESAADTELTLETAAAALLVKSAEQEQVINLKEKIYGGVWDVALAVYKALQQVFGFVATAGFLPQVYKIASGPHGETVDIPFAQFKAPGVEGSMAPNVDWADKAGPTFFLSAAIKRKHSGKFEQIIKAAREILARESIYRAKALKVDFANGDKAGTGIVEPQFLDVSRADRSSLILSERVAAAVETSVFTPIEFAARCAELGIPKKRGVLLSGMYGTGKTLTAYVAAKLCTESGRTFVYVETADQLAQAVQFALQYSPALVFCEDIDRALAGQRTASVDEILNTVDGIDTKTADLMIILTTNNAAAINRAMVRPGRLDDVIEFAPPDAATVARLIRFYAGSLLEEDTYLELVAAELAGQIPAVIRECVERAKLSAVKLSRGAPGALAITGEALLDSAYTMGAQLRLLSAAEPGMGAYEAVGRLVAAVAGRGAHDPDSLQVAFLEAPRRKGAQEEEEVGRG